jgi:NADH:ubiquinone oxidoreductase subunit 6 (subunit J)
MWHNGPFDTLMMFTTTISVISMYSTSRVVMVPIIWLYITVVVVVISFSIIVCKKQNKVDDRALQNRKLLALTLRI